MWSFQVPTKTIYPIEERERERPRVEFRRESVALLASRYVKEINDSDRLWAEYLIPQMKFATKDEGQCRFPEEWKDLESEIMAWDETEIEVAKDEKTDVGIEGRGEEEEQASGMLTKNDTGFLVFEVGDYKLYERFERAPFNIDFAMEYMTRMKDASRDIHPMKIDYDNPLDQGRMFRKRRFQVAMELLGEYKRSTEKRKPLYIPGDGLGFFSLAARVLDLEYVSSEPGDCGRLAVLMGLITVKDVYRGFFDDHVLVASQLVQFVPDILTHNGPMIIYDEQRWYEGGRGGQLKIVLETGHQVAYTGNLLDRYVPCELRMRPLTSREIDYILLKLDESDGGCLVCNDRKLLVRMLMGGLPVYTEAYADLGPAGWLRPPPVGMICVRFGRSKGEVDVREQSDVNVLSPQQRVPVMLGSAGMRVYSPYHEDYVLFEKMMVWTTGRHYYELRGEHRTRMKYRARKWPMHGKEVVAIRTRLQPDAVVVVQYGRAIRSAEVKFHLQETIGMWRYFPVELGQEVGVQKFVMVRTYPDFVARKRQDEGRWWNKDGYDESRENGERPWVRPPDNDTV